MCSGGAERECSLALCLGLHPRSTRQLSGARTSKSASSYSDFVCEERAARFCEQEQGYWTEVLPFSVICMLLGIRLSPMGVVPQRYRQPRIIVDYSFSIVNRETVRMVLPEAMRFGRALHRVMTKFVHADRRFGPCKLAKIDVADGFYRMWVQTVNIPKVDVILPNNGGALLAAFPLTLPMGWIASPPYFTTMTETACNLVNAAVKSDSPGLPHQLKAAAATPPENVSSPRWTDSWTATQSAFDRQAFASATLSAADVYVDNSLLMAQTQPYQTRLVRLTLNAIDQVLCPLERDDLCHRKARVCEKAESRGRQLLERAENNLGVEH